MKLLRLMAWAYENFYQHYTSSWKTNFGDDGFGSALAYWNDWTNGLYYLSGNDGQKLYSIQNLLNQMITDIQYLASGKVTGNIGAEVAKLPTTSILMVYCNFIAMLPLFIIIRFSCRNILQKASHLEL